MSFRARVAVLIAMVVAIVVAVVAGSFLYMARATSLRTLDDTLRDRAAVLVQLGDKLGRPQEFDRRLFGRYAPDDVMLQVFDTRGRIWASNVEPLPITRDDLAIARGNSRSRIGTSEVAEYRMRILTVPLKMPGRAVMIARPMDEVDNLLAGLWRISLQIFVIGVAGAGISGFVIASRVVRPVKRLTQAANDVAVTQDVDQPIEVQRDDEFGQLAASFNQMLSALSASREQQHRLVTDASHELRTPITSLRTNLEHIQRSASIPENERQEILDDVLFELDELTGLVTELVELATDRHQMDDPSLVELDDLVDVVVQRHQRRTSSPIELTAEPCQVMAVPALLERAISNMLDNALKWSPPAAAIHVEVVDGSVTVRDDGPGISLDERERVFERFYRSEDAKSSPGSGLGLSIVRHVAENFGGDARILDEGDRGTAVKLWLPPIN